MERDSYGQQQPQESNKPIQYFVEVPPPPRIKESPAEALERLRQQSTIQVLPVQLHGEHAMNEELEVGSRDSLQTILNSFRDESTTATIRNNCDTQESPVNRSHVSRRYEETPSVHVKSPATAQTTGGGVEARSSSNNLKTILDAFDDDNDDTNSVV